MGRQNVPRDQWLELGYECPRCGEQITEEDVHAWRPMPEDPKLLLLYCRNCGDSSDGSDCGDADSTSGKAAHARASGGSQRRTSAPTYTCTDNPMTLSPVESR